MRVKVLCLPRFTERQREKCFADKKCERSKTDASNCTLRAVQWFSGFMVQVSLYWTAVVVVVRRSGGSRGAVVVVRFGGAVV